MLEEARRWDFRENQGTKAEASRMSRQAKKVLAIGLDGFEHSLAEAMMARGELRELTSLRHMSATMLLDHGVAQRTGLAWEHVASGLSPTDAERWAAVHFDPATYQVWQEGTSMTPFTEGLKDVHSVVFDAPYFDLRRTQQISGIVGWGAHDPGVECAAQPNGLLDEFTERFGEYPAKDYIYPIAWPCPRHCRDMGESLSDAVDLRTEASLWLLGERITDWDLALVVVSEPHSAIEGLWHGVDPAHPLHQIPSAATAREGLLNVYRAVDRLVGHLKRRFADATLVLFSMGGMGSNQSDVASMVLVAELLHRHCFGSRHLGERQDWASAKDGLPQLQAHENWHQCLAELFPDPRRWPERIGIPRGLRISSTLATSMKEWFSRGRSQWQKQEQDGTSESGPTVSALRWMPLTHYGRYWHRMEAFAIPSFYDGRIRVNLKGRERSGRVHINRYWETCERLRELLLECRDPRTGSPVVQDIEFPSTGRNPLTLGPTESDLVVSWTGPLALDHPRYGRIGPIPYRRTGGHTGPHGMAWLAGPDLAPGDYGVHSSFDIVPTLVDLLRRTSSRPLSGASLLPLIRGGRSEGVEST